ncbi:MAG: hypothetical protein ACRDJY_00230 [Thermoleophilaceae bacterium]
MKESYVRLHAPMPESSPEHSEACDWISYLRFRHVDGPRRSSRADAVLTLMPGIFAGAGSFDQVARNTVRRAAKRGRMVEVWGIDRRSNCLEDHRGVRAGVETGDPRVSFGYYFEGREVDGHIFPGFADEQEAAFLRDVGLKQTIEDWHTIITREMPSRRKRQRKLICGGHSLGGPLTAALASWDFDGDPETDEDAGYNQCAAFVGLDTTVSLEGSGGAGGGPGVALITNTTAQSGASPFINVPPLTPETLLAPALIGVTAFQKPDEETITTQLIPRDAEWDLTLRLLFSRNPQEAATGSPSVRDFRVTNASALAAVFDDNSSPISIFRASVGMYTGGPLVDKSFPAPDPTLAAPEEEHGPLYHWQNYSRVGANGAELELNDEGDPYTSRDSEVTDIRQLGRSIYQFPANLIESYFPTRLVTDFAAMTAGDRSGDLENLSHDGPSMKPILLVQAGDSDGNDGADEGPTKAGEKPNDRDLSREAILPGYNHLDVATAAWKQNDGRKEGSSFELARYMLKVIGPRK